MRTQAAVLAFILLASSTALAAAPNPFPKVPAVQAAISEAGDAMLLVRGSDPNPEQALQDLAQDVVTAAGGDLALVAEQLIAATYDYDLLAEGDAGMARVFCCYRLLEGSNASRRQILDAIAPHMSISDPVFERFVYVFLDKIALEDTAVRPNYTTIETFASEKIQANEAVPPTLIEYMVATQSAKAVPVLERLYDPTDTITDLNQQTLEDIRELHFDCRYGLLKSEDPRLAALKPLVVGYATDSRWWVRLFAAEIMVKCLDMLADPSAAALAQDTNDLVKKRGLAIAAYYAN